MSMLTLREKMRSPLRAMWRLRRGLILLCTPLLLLPLPLCVPTKEASCAYVIALMAVYWCTEVLPLAVTALLPTLLFPLMGIMKSKDVCMQYLKDTNMLFVGGLIVAVAVEHWNLHKRIALRVLLIVGVRPALLMLGFMGVTAFLSMWISNTATTAMMVPIVQAVLAQLNRPKDSQCTSRNQNDSVAPQEEHQEKTITNSLLCTTQIPENGSNGMKTDVQEVSVTAHVTPMPAGGLHSAVQADENEKGCQPLRAVVVLPAPGPSSQMQPGDLCVEEEEGEEEMKTMCKGMLLCVCYAASIGGIATLTGTGPNLVLMGQLSQLYPRNGDVINFASWFVFAFPTMLLMLTLAWLWLQFLYIGSNLRRTLGCGSTQTEEERAVYDILREEHRRLGPMCYAELSVMALFLLLVALWFTRDPGFIDGWATRVFNAEAEFVTDATIALFVAVLLFVLPSAPPDWLLWWRSSDAESPGPRRTAPALLTWQVTQKKMPWNIVLLLGGGFALAKGSEVSGLSLWLGEQMRPLSSIPTWAIAIVLCLLVGTFTECASNVATATLFLPILASTSQSIGVNPLYLMVPCTLSASFAFMLPVATPPNAIVFSSGYLKVSDMARTGVVMNVLGILCITLAINSWGRVLFDLNTFPPWANTTAAV